MYLHKSYLRSAVAQTRLSGIAIINIERSYAEYRKNGTQDPQRTQNQEFNEDLGPYEGLGPYEDPGS